ncbi:undecaprenyl-diphosphatase UppP [Candidatus Parcubacteria bacterium]|nr:undecaprenyl-diphosphatase UppP [Candidatus Parcubacteria bacterium]
MEYVLAAIFGVIQGATEFLPVSSSGHLVLLHDFFDLDISSELSFDIVLHFATILAVIIFFRKDVIRLLKSWIFSLFGKKNQDSKLAWLIILGTIPAAIFGLLLSDYIEKYLRNPFVVVFMLVFVGILFFVFENIAKKTKEIESLNVKKVLLIGFAQALALIPGTSRSGATILAGLGIGLKREVAIKFSFLLSIPIILGANLKEMPEFFKVEMAESELMILTIAFIFSFISGILTIKFFLNFAKKYTLKSFAIYRFILAFILLCMLCLR